MGAFSRSELEYAHLLHFLPIPASRKLDVALDLEDATPEGVVLSTSRKKLTQQSRVATLQTFRRGRGREGRKKKDLSNFYFLLRRLNSPG